MDIRCRKTSCVHNNKQTCQAKGILIEKNIICDTYEKDDTKPEIDASKSIFNSQQNEYGRQRDTKTMNIECKTDCIFNDNGKCVANGITVNALVEPYCITYLKK